MTSCGLYVRMSQDRAGGGLGVERQEKDCRALVKRRGWKVAEVYVDNDVSASSRRPRPAWLRLLADVEAGKIEAIAAWHVDRLTRSPVELEGVIAFAEGQGLELATVTGDVDLATPTGRMVARMLGAAARAEIEHKSERQQRERRDSAARGEIVGGGTRPYGYASDKITVVKAEAKVIQEAARRVLDGESMSSISRDLQRRDVQTPKGNHWQPRTLRRLLASARISGRREHQPVGSYSGTRPLLGEIVAERAVWPAIISPATSDRLRAMLSSSRQPSLAPARRYAFSGILRCGLCTAGLVGRPRNGVPRYVCPNVPGGKSCGKIAANAARVDEAVREKLLVYLDSSDFARMLRSAQRSASKTDESATRLSDQLVQDRARLTEIGDDYADRLISRVEFRRLTERVQERIADAERQLTNAEQSTPMLALADQANSLRRAWDRMSIDERRVVVHAVADEIIVDPAPPPKNQWNAERIRPQWRFS